MSDARNLEAIQAIESLMTCDLISGPTKTYLLELRDMLLSEVEPSQQDEAATA